MYVAVKGGEVAINRAHQLLADRRRADRSVPALSLEQITGQLALAVDRIMAEGSLYDPELAAMALRQSRGDMIEAIFLLRAYRTTLPRFGYSQPIDTANMRIERRVSATYKDIPGGQLLGPTFDYTHRLIDPAMAEDGDVQAAERRDLEPDVSFPRVTDILNSEGLIEGDIRSDKEPGDITRDPTSYPVTRDIRLQALARGDEGFLLSLGYSTQRGYGRNHPFVGEIRIGFVSVEIEMPELGFALELGEIRVTECQMVTQFTGTTKDGPCFTRGYGLVFGQSERKAMAISLVDRALRADEFDEQRDAPAQNEEFVLSHCDNVEATGFVEHLKLPHYVDFQAELELLRTLQKEHAAANASTEEACHDPA